MFHNTAAQTNIILWVSEAACKCVQHKYNDLAQKQHKTLLMTFFERH